MSSESSSHHHHADYLHTILLASGCCHGRAGFHHHLSLHLSHRQRPGQLHVTLQMMSLWAVVRSFAWGRPVLSSPTGQSLPSLDSNEAGDSTAAREDETLAARAEILCANMAVTTTNEPIGIPSADSPANIPRPSSAERGLKGSSPMGRRLEACMPGKALRRCSAP